MSNKDSIVGADNHANTVTTENNIVRLPNGATIMVECYDEHGNILTATDNDTGKRSWYEYDNLNRIIKVTNESGFSESYEYDDKGDIVKNTDN